MTRLILASGSHIRAELLRRAGFDFTVRPADLDERAAALPLLDAGAPGDDIALVLAEAKATAVAALEGPDAHVIGCDQTLEIDGDILSKPPDMEAARAQLLRLSGKTHTLHAAVVLASGEDVLWRHVESVHLTMRKLQPAEVGRYLAAAGPGVLSSVGAYQVEGRGITLFDRIEGDYFAILGLPLLPLLKRLREEGIEP